MKPLNLKQKKLYNLLVTRPDLTVYSACRVVTPNFTHAEAVLFIRSEGFKDYLKAGYINYVYAYHGKRFWKAFWEA